MPKDLIDCFVRSKIEELDPGNLWITIGRQHTDLLYGAISIGQISGKAEFNRGGGQPITNCSS